MNKDKAKLEVQEIVDRFLKIPKNERDSMPEEKIKSWFIEPLFEALGWSRYDMSKEERVLKGRADYVVRIGNQDKLVIEAKKTSVGLNEEEGRQAVSYAYHKNIKFAILTNFSRIRVFHALSNIKNIDKNLLKDKTDYLRFNCEDFVKDFDRLWLLSRESFEQGEINKLLDNVDKKLIKPIDESILTDLLQYRGWLSKDLKSKRSYLEDSQIDEIVQILIDRLIFMRSVEDRKLEAEDFLLKIINDVEKGFTDMNLWSVLKAQFSRFDTIYNSKLFQDGILEKEGFFDNGVLVKVIKGLYYGTQKDHQERYMFDEIPVDLLGSIYEQYLGVVLRGTEKRVKLDLLSRKRKKMGIYYTPSYIVDYIVKNTIGEYVKNKSLDEILDIKVIDPACGSGSFLIKSFQELINIIEERLKKGEKSEKYQNTFKEWKGKLSLGEKTTILTNCIYGVDLDEKAVELAQLNLLLKILEEETRETRKRVLPTMKDNIKNGNSLISDSRFDKAFNWNAQFPNVFRDGGFDVVIGNPPYVRGDLLKEIKPYLEGNYKTYSGSSDLFVYFFEKGISILKDKGKFGFIVSNKFTRANYGINLRKYLLDNLKIEDYIDKFEEKVFEDASVDPCIIILTKTNKNKDNLFTYNYFSKINQDSLTSQSWAFGDEEKIKLLEKIKEQGKKLIDVIGEVKAGIKTGLNDVLIVNEEKIKEIVGKNEREREVFVPLIMGKDIKKWTYKFNDNFLIFLDGKDINNYPNVKRYLLRHKKRLENRSDIKGKNKKWYELRSCAFYNLFKKPKIIWPDISQGSNFTFDEKGVYLDMTCFFIATEEKALLGLLNSKLLLFYFDSICSKLGEKGYRFKRQYIHELPIKLPDKKQEEKIIELVEQMLELQKKIRNEGISGNEKVQLEQQIKNVDYEIDEEVYNLYSLTKEEIKVVEEFGK